MGPSTNPNLRAATVLTLLLKGHRVRVTLPGAKKPRTIAMSEGFDICAVGVHKSAGTEQLMPIIGLRIPDFIQLCANMPEEEWVDVVFAAGMDRG